MDKLLSTGMNDLRKNQAEFERIAKEIDPTGTPQEVLKDLHGDASSAGCIARDVPRNI